MMVATLILCYGRASCWTGCLSPCYSYASELEGICRQMGFYSSSGLSCLLSFHQGLHLAQSAALLSRDDSLFLSTSGKDLTQAENRHMLYTRQSLSIAREQVPTQTLIWGLGSLH